MLRQSCPSDIAIDVASPDDGPPVVESQVDAALVFPALRAAAGRWTEDGYDAVIIGCFSDPGIDAFREVTGCPVIGPGEAAMLAALQFGDRFSVLSSDPTPAGLRRRIRAMGIAERFASERLAGASVTDLRQKPDAAFERMISSAEACRRDGADVLVLGCLAACFIEGLPERLQAATGIPVINPVIAGLKSAETALRRGAAGSTNKHRV